MTEFHLNTLTDYSEPSLINELIRVSKLVEGKLSKTKFVKYSKVHSSTIEKRFGTWGKALEKAGLSEYFDDSNKKIYKEEIIREIERVASKLKTNKLTVKDFNKHSQISYGTIKKEFGSWKNAMDSVNLEISNHGKRYTDEECFENLLEVWTHYGRQPSFSEMKRTPSIIGPKAYILRWGNWRNALKAFVDRVNQDIEIHVQEKENKPKIKVENKISESDRREIKLGLRYEILKRDHFKCVICGASPSIKPECELHIDHITPFSKGGKTVKENLRTLCKECNLGKGNKIE